MCFNHINLDSTKTFDMYGTYKLAYLLIQINTDVHFFVEKIQEELFKKVIPLNSNILRYISTYVIT